MKDRRKIIQYITLIIFIALIALGKVQLWMVAFGSGLLLSVIKGRLYCGYICPINTVMEVIDGDAAKKRRKRVKTPNWMKSNIVRIGTLGLFILTFIFVRRTGRQLPVLPALFVMGVVLTIYMESAAWHRYLCPYGTLFSIFSRKNKSGYTINYKDCNSCGLCIRNCPADVIKWKDRKTKPVIMKNDCIVCGKCEEVCIKDAIYYDKEGASQLEQ